MKFYELAPVIMDNEFTLFVSSDDYKDHYRVYKDDAFDEIIWEFGFADVVGIDTSWEDLSVYTWSNIPSISNDCKLRYNIIGYDKGSRFRIDIAQSYEEAKQKAYEASAEYRNIAITIESRKKGERHEHNS